MKYVILVGDGMGDMPVAELGDRTPLDAAVTPAIDALARKGVLYTVATVPSGMAPGSDVANLSLLGYCPSDFYSGRAPLEAASMGVTLRDGEIAYRCNLVTLEKSADGSVKMVDYSAGHITTEEAAQLIDALNDSLGSEDICFHQGVSYRHLLVTSLQPENVVSVPPHDYTDKDVTKFWQQYEKHSGLSTIMNTAFSVLADHPVNKKRVANNLPPANGIWLWGEGKQPTMPTLQQQFGISGALISAVDLLKGIAVYAGMEVANVVGATGYLDTNYQGKVEGALAAIKRHDMIFVHVEAPDEASHHGLLSEKIQAIEDFDAKIVGPIVNGLREAGEEFRLMVAMDHYTPVSTKTHDARPVPILLHDSRWGREHPELAYTERHAAQYGNYLANGTALIKTLLDDEEK